MFLVSDNREYRSQKIRSLIDIDIEIAVLVAAADFEWTCRRCILSLGQSPTKYIREHVLKKATLSKYPTAWKQEVSSRGYVTIEEIIPNFKFKDNAAFDLRNKIIHGELGTVNFDFGKETVENILSASEALANFAEDHLEGIYRMIKRIKKRL